MIEWDEIKRLANLVKHSFDFIDARDVIYGLYVVLPAWQVGSERRYLAVGMIGNRFATVVYTMRDSDYRIISIRSARDDERRKYQAIHQ